MMHMHHFEIEAPRVTMEFINQKDWGEKPRAMLDELFTRYTAKKNIGDELTYRKYLYSRQLSIALTIHLNKTLLTQYHKKMLIRQNMIVR